MFLKLPELGEGVHEGELVKWRVKEGDIFKDDQPVCDIMTDKATIELPAPFHGKITKLMAKEGEMIHVGQDIIQYEHIGAAAAGTSASPGATASASVVPLRATTAAPVSNATPPAAASVPMSAAPMSAAATGASAAKISASPAPAVADNNNTSPLGNNNGVSLGALSIGGSVTAAPSTRRFAREAGVDITQVPSSGPNGRVMREDIERLLNGAGNGAGATSAGSPMLARTGGTRPAASQLEERIAFKGLRKKIAERMRLSKDKAAHFTYVDECDATALVELRKQAKEIGAKQGIKVTYLPFVMKAMVCALKRFPIMNASLDETTNEIVIKHYYNIGLSIQTEDGLTAPNIKNVESKGILQIAKEIQEVVERARTKKLTQEDFAGGTITLTNAGSIGGLLSTPVIQFPEVAIIGFNKIVRKPVVVVENGKETIAIRDWTLFSISLDHRIVDGAIGAEWMNLFMQYIQNPSLMLLEG